MSESNRVRVGYIEEPTFETTPTSGTLQVVRRTGGGFVKETDTTESAEVRDDRALADVIRTNARATGDIAFELSMSTFDNLFEGTCGNDWSPDIGISGNSTVSALAADNSFNGTGLFTNASPGQWIRVAGLNTAQNNGFHQVATASNDKVTTTSTLADDAAGAPVDIHGSYLRSPGPLNRSYTIEQAHLDISTYLWVIGARIGSMDLSVSVGEIITGNLNFLGSDLVTSTTTLPGLTLGSPTTTEVVNAVDNVAMIYEGGASSALCFESLSFNLENGLRENSCIGKLGPNDILPGTARTTGSLAAYFENRTLLDKYLAFTPSSFSFLIYRGASATAGQSMMLTFPKIRFTSGNADASAGLDADVLVNLDFTSVFDPTSSSTLQFDRFPT